MNARGMPSVELTQTTKDDIKQEAEDARPKTNLEIFVSPKGSEDSASQSDQIVKPAEAIGSDAEAPLKKTPVKKPKRKLTDKQLEALKLGREKSIETRRKNKEEKKVQKAKEVLEGAPHQSAPPQAPPQVSVVTAPAPPTHIDYDKIINGVVGKMETLKSQRENREHLVAENVNAFEEKIRNDERTYVLKEIEDMQKKEDQERASIMAHKYLSKPKPVVDNNPYAYALQMGANSRYRRY